jgi:hypothetical protein
MKLWLDRSPLIRKKNTHYPFLPCKKGRKIAKERGQLVAENERKMNGPDQTEDIQNCMHA